MSNFRSKTIMLTMAVGLLAVSLIMLNSSVWATSSVTRGVLSFTFDAPDYEITTDEMGLSTIEMAGFYPHGLPGNPELPSALYYIALPPLVPLDSVTLEIDGVEQTEFPGDYQIAPAGPDLYRPEDEPMEYWGPNAPTIAGGKNTAVYENDAYFPIEPVELAAVSQMRKWRIAELRFYPVSYNPASGRLRLTKQVTVTLRYDLPDVQRVAAAELQDTLMDDRAAELFLNYDEARLWYENALKNQGRKTSVQPGYVIITTKQIKQALETNPVLNPTFEEFKKTKTQSGYKVDVITVEDLDSIIGQAPNERPEKIRQWLQDNYLAKNIEYVLLIGDPDPPRVYPLWTLGPDMVGDLPMKTTWPPGLTLSCNYPYAVTAASKNDNEYGMGTTKITCPDLPIRVTLTPEPAQLSPDGDDVVYTVVVANNSQAPVTINSLEGDVFGDLNSKNSTCSVPQKIRVGGSYTCAYKRKVTLGNDPYIKNTVTAAGPGANDEDISVTNSDSAVVTRADKGLLVTITATPNELSIPGGNYKDMFHLTVTNTTQKDVTLGSLNDWGYGNLDGVGNCTTFTKDENGNVHDRIIKAGETYECTYDAYIRLASLAQHATILFGTDHYYADLTGNWDLDGDGMYADPGDYLPGGVDLWPEVIVGRIPVYTSRDSNWVKTLDDILNKSEEYEKSTNRDWRRSALLPMGFLEPYLDSAHLGKAVETFLVEDAGFTDAASHTMYMGSTNCKSELSSDEPLQEGIPQPDGTVQGRDQVFHFWEKNPVGIVIMGSHGNESVATFAQNCLEKDTTVTFGIDNANNLPTSLQQKPALAFLTACSIGMPGTPNNLGYALLRTGSIGTVSATAMSFYPDRWSEPVPASTDQLSLAYYYMRYVVLENYSTGEALFAATRSPNDMMNALGFNLYGDPSLRLMLSQPVAGNDRFDVAKGQPLVVSAPGVLADDISANGDPRVYYLAENPEQRQPLVQELSGHHISWHSLAVPTNFGSPPSIFSPLTATSVGGKPRIYYRAVGDHIHELAYDGDQWHDSDVTEKSGAPPTSAWKLASISVNGDPRLYYFSEDKHIHELAWANGTWRHRDITLDAGAPAATEGSPLSVATITNDDPRVFYVTPDLHIHELAYRSLTRVWSHSDLTSISGAPLINAMPAGRNALASTTVNSLARVYFLAADQHIYELRWDKETGYRWGYSDITKRAGELYLAYANSALAATTTGNGDIPRVYYLAPDQDDAPHVRELTWLKAKQWWNDIGLTNQVDGTPVVRDSPLAAVTIRSLPHVYYLDDGRRVNELAIRGEAWVHGPITASAGGPVAVAGNALAVTTADGGPLTANLVSSVSHGALTLNPDGSFSYTPEANFPSRGYSALDTFVYKANDGTGSSTETTVTLEVINECAPADHNLIKNYCFIEGKTPWQFFQTNRQGRFTISQNNPFAGKYSARVDIRLPAGNIQLYQPGITLKPNTPYELAFAAYSDDGRDMSLYLHRHNHDGTYTNYGLAGQRVDLEPYWKWFVVTFTTPDIGNTNNARLRFWFSPFAKAGTVYHIDRVLLRPADRP